MAEGWIEGRIAIDATIEPPEAHGFLVYASTQEAAEQRLVSLLEVLANEF